VSRQRLARVVRRLADWLDTTAAPPPPPNMTLVSRAELREIQMTGLRMIRDFSFVSRERGPAEGLVWFPREILQSFAWLIKTEIETRERDFAAIEQDPRAAIG